MAAAGLTHGGFYGHFESKDALAAEACERAAEQSDATWKRRMAGLTDRGEIKRVLIDAYLSARSRNNASTSCATAALVSDVAREPETAPVRAAYLKGVEERVAVLTSIQNTGDAALDRQQALAAYSLMIGALLLSRATSGNAVSDEILEAAKKQLLR